MYSRLADAAATLTRRSHGYMAAVVGGGIVAYGAHYGLYGTHPFQNSSVPKSSADGDTKKDDAGFHWVQSGTRTQQQFKQELTLGQRLSHFAIWGAIGLAVGTGLAVSLRRIQKSSEKSEFMSRTLTMLSRDPRVTRKLGNPLLPVGHFRGKSSEGEARGFFLCRGPVVSENPSVPARSLQEGAERQEGSNPTIPSHAAVVNMDAQYREDDWRFDQLEVILPQAITGNKDGDKTIDHSLLKDIHEEFPGFKPGEMIKIAPTDTGSAVYSNQV